MSTTESIEVDVDNHSSASHLLAVGGNDAKKLLKLIGGSRRENVRVSCGACSYVASLFAYYGSPTNRRWKMTVPKKKIEARQMWNYVGARGGDGFKFRGRYSFSAGGGDSLDLDPPSDW